MNRLSAVNEILECIGEPPAAVLDTGGGSEVADAERILDRENRHTQTRGWIINETKDKRILVPETVLTLASVTGTFEHGETVTESGSGATGTWSHIDDGGFAYVFGATGNFAGIGGTLTGGDSGATATVNNAEIVTGSTVYADPNWITVSPAVEYGQRLTTQNFSVRGERLWNNDDTEGSWDVGTEIRADVIFELEFEKLPSPVGNLVIANACMAFQRYRKAGVVDDAFVREKKTVAQAMAHRWYTSQLPPGILHHNESHRRLVGHRNRGY